MYVTQPWSFETSFVAFATGHFKSSLVVWMARSRILSVRIFAMSNADVVKSVVGEQGARVAGVTMALLEENFLPAQRRFRKSRFVTFDIPIVR